MLKMRLKNKVAVITGGTSGIGLATAILFAKEGAKVVIAGRDITKAKKAINKIGKGTIFIKTDVSNELEVKKLIDSTIKKFKRIDVLYNNAGIELAKPVIETSEEEWDKVLNINLKGVFFGCKYAIPHMIKNKGGSIINTASTAGIVGFPNLGAYCASKGGIVLLTKEIALDYAKQGIRVNCVCPGAILTPMVKRFTDKAPNPKKAMADLAAMHPMGRAGQPEEIANAVLFLASNESSFVTGHALVVDGGLTAQ